MVGLTAVQHRQVREYSKGMQRRIGIAQALINDPEFLILDEPTTGLDPIGTKQVKDLIIALGRRGKTILLSSHLLSDVEDCVTRMVILYGGKIRQEGTCDDLLTARSRSIIETEALDDATLEHVRAVLNEHHKHIERVSAPRQKLEDLFIDIVKSAQAERLATSGATHAGATAAFLVGQGEPTEGRDLIESLTRKGPDLPEDERPMEVESRDDRDPEIIDQLLAGGRAGEPAAPEERPAPAGGTPTPEPRTPSGAEPGADEVDDSIIDSLLKGGAPDEDDSRPRGDRDQ